MEAGWAGVVCRHRGNAEVVCQELQRVHGVDVSLRTVEGLLRRVEGEARVTVRFETPPGKQMQKQTFPCLLWLLGCDPEGLCALPSPNQGQMRKWCGLRETQCHCRRGIWLFQQPSCPPSVLDAKGGRCSPPWHHRRAPHRSFPRGGKHKALRALQGRAPFQRIRELCRKVHKEACVEVDTNRYSVPWRLIGEQTQVLVDHGQVKIFHAGTLVAEHGEISGRRGCSLQPEHLKGVVRLSDPTQAVAVRSELLRPLAEYEQVAGGGW